jgi:hypothetical protein
VEIELCGLVEIDESRELFGKWKKWKEVSSPSQKQKELLGVYNITKPSYERILSDASAEVSLRMQ